MINSISDGRTGPGPSSEEEGLYAFYGEIDCLDKPPIYNDTKPTIVRLYS